MSDWKFIFRDTTEECSPTPCRVEGTIPSDLEGAYVANGAGLLTLGEQRVNAFDAHARITSFQIAGGGVSFAAKILDTPLRRAELAAGKMVKRRIFTNKPNRWANLFDIDFGNNAIHNIYPWGGSLVAAQDPGHFLVDPQTLATKGRAPFGTPEKKGVNLAPMPRFDPATDRLIVYKHTPGLKDSIVVEELDRQWGVVKSASFKLPRGAMFFHDVAFTENYYVVIQWSSLSVARALWGAGTVSTAVDFDPTTTPLLVLLPRSGQGPVKAIPIPGKLIFHIFNAFEDGGTLVVDGVGYDARLDFSVFREGSVRDADYTSLPALPLRLRADLDKEKSSLTLIATTSCETPEVNHAFHGKRTRYGYAVAQTEPGGETDSNAYPWFRGIAKLDFENAECETWSAGKNAFCSPPSFAPRTGATLEDDGYLLSWVQPASDSGATGGYLAILDARALGRGPVAKAFVDLPRGFISHAEFAPSHYFAS